MIRPDSVDPGADPWEELANAIILQSVKDYRKALRETASDRTVKECEKFFRSKWFRILTAIDGKMLIRKLREEVGAYDDRGISVSGAKA